MDRVLSSLNSRLTLQSSVNILGLLGYPDSAKRPPDLSPSRALVKQKDIRLDVLFVLAEAALLLFCDFDHTFRISPKVLFQGSPVSGRPISG